MRDKHQTDRLFTELYGSYYRAVVSFFVRRGYDLEEARDLAQTVFLRVYESMETYRDEARWAFLRRVATRVWLNEIRGEAAQKRDVHETSLEELDQPPARDDGDREILRRERGRLWREATRELSAEDQHCLDLWLQGYTSKEIASALKMSSDAVRSRMTRTKRKLRDEVRKAGNPIHEEDLEADEPP